MKGIVVEEPVHRGNVNNNGMIPLTKMKNLNQISSYEFSQKTFNIPQQPLLSTSGFQLRGDVINPIQSIILTTTHFTELPIKEIKKLKIYRKSEMAAYSKLKIESQNAQKILLIQKNQCYQFSVTCFWTKMITMGIDNDHKEEFINCCDGDVMKKSEILKLWEPRYLLITAKDGLMSFRDRDQAPTLTVESIDQFWTRFQLIQGYKYVVFKFWHSIIKYEFAVPTHRAVKWFKAFYSLLAR